MSGRATKGMGVAAARIIWLRFLIKRYLIARRRRMPDAAMQCCAEDGRTPSLARRIEPVWRPTNQSAAMNY
jgi:hypothetical protein